jgi:GTP cyclohydrolase I
MKKKRKEPSKKRKRRFNAEDTHRKIAYHMRHILQLLRFDPTNDPNFTETPDRVANIFMQEMFPIKPTTKLVSMFPKGRLNQKGQMVILRNHIAQSRCPHHLERVFFDTTVGYLPDKYYLGASKLARIPDYYAHGAVLQETYTENIAQGIMDAIKPLGVGVLVHADHQCMQCRGVKTVGHMTTSALRGVFFEKKEVRDEFMFLVAHRRGK